MLTVYIQVRVKQDDVLDALALGAADAYQSRLAAEYPSPDPALTVIEYRIDYLDADSTGPEQEQAIARIRELLALAEVEYEHHGNGVSVGSGLSKSKFVVAPRGSTDPRASLTMWATDRAEFIDTLTRLLGSAPDLDLYDVTVEGLAANDPT